jgi:putative ribosome biogenesis GTPase RsgA
LQAGPPLSLVLNKTDLLPPEELAATLALAADWGYAALPVCAATGDGLTELAERLAGRVTVLAGPSGVPRSPH